MLSRREGLGCEDVAFGFVGDADLVDVADHLEAMLAGEWFNQEGASSGLVTCANVFDILERGKHDENGFGVPTRAAQLAEDRHAVRMRHGEVNDDQSRNVFGADVGEVIEALLSAAEPDERVEDFALAENALRKQPIIGGIINNQDRLHCTSKPHRYWGKRNPLIWLGVSIRGRKRRLRTEGTADRGFREEKKSFDRGFRG